MRAVPDEATLAWQHRAAAALFINYLVLTIAAAVPTMIAVAAVEGTVAAHPAGVAALYRPGGAELIEAVDRARGGLSTAAIALVAATLLLILMQPLLSMLLLNSLARSSRSWRDQLRAAFADYPAALGVSLFLLPVLLLAGLALALPPIAVTAAWTHAEDVRAHDLTTLAAALPGMAAVAAWACMHDLARARLAWTEGDTGRIRRAWMAARHGITTMRFKAVALYLAFVVCGQTVAWLGLGAIIAVDGPGLTRGLACLVIGQSAIGAQLLVRTRWLAWAVARTAPNTPATLHPRGCTEGEPETAIPPDLDPSEPRSAYTSIGLHLDRPTPRSAQTSIGLDLDLNAEGLAQPEVRLGDAE